MQESIHTEIIFDETIWKRKLEKLVNEVVELGDPEVAITCLYLYDKERKRIDRIQGYPEHGAHSELRKKWQ